jgi:Reverse transcriptase (RNA-dependent DNA polymerase)
VLLKRKLEKDFEVKDLGQLRYFFGIEIARGAEGIVLSQRKYMLDLLAETGMLGCRPAVAPIDQKFKLSAEAGKPVDRERHQRLVGRLIYLSHTRPDISFAVSVVIPERVTWMLCTRFWGIWKMHQERGWSSGKMDIWTLRVIVIQAGLVALMTGSPRLDTACL